MNLADKLSILAGAIGLGCCLMAMPLAIAHEVKAAPAQVRWEVRFWSDMSNDPRRVPDGWEPFGYASGGYVLLKRRVP
jgi:hypothetical protein